MEALELVLALAVGVALAACAGLRAFVPLLVTGLLARTGHYPVPLQQHLEWLSSTPALVALSIATAVEMIADKVPALDHALDVAQTPVRTVAGAIVAAAAFSKFPTWAAVLLGLTAGGTTAFSVHAAKATVRAGSTVTTGTIANPILSFFEDVVSWVGAVLAPLFAVCALVMATIALGLMFWFGRKVWRRFHARPASPG
jgi:hypothetical protein